MLLVDSVRIISFLTNCFVQQLGHLRIIRMVFTYSKEKHNSVLKPEYTARINILIREIHGTCIYIYIYIGRDRDSL